MPTSATRDVVTFKILLGNAPFSNPDQEVSGQIQVEEMIIYTELNKIPYATIKILDGSAADSDFAISSSGEFALGKSINIQMGYSSDDESVFRGIIVSKSHLVTSTRSNLLLTCKHESVKMTISPKSRHFNDLTDKDIVEQLLSENGLTDLDIPSFGSAHEQLLQANVCDWDFAMSRIDSTGMASLISGPQFKVLKPDPSLDPVETLTYGANILSLFSETDIRSQATAVKAFSWDFTNQSVLESEGTDLASAYPGNVQESTMAEFNGQEFEIRTSGKFTNEAHG